MATAQSIFVIDPSSLGDMDAKRGTALVCSVLRCEATRLKLPLQRVVISSKISAKDGGIDAKVEDVPDAASLLKKGSSYLQIKTGATFKPWLKTHLLKELFGKEDAIPSKVRLGKEIKTCLEKKGRYVLITLGHDLLPIQHSDAAALLLELLKKCRYKHPEVDVLGQGQIVGILGGYPSLCLDLKGLGEAPFQSFAGWSQNADMKTFLRLGEAQRKFIGDVRGAWRGQQIQHVRVVGEPGIGKTRLVLEAAAEEDLRAATIYIPHAEDFQKSALFNELLKPDRQYTVNLVVDECEENERASIWNSLKGKPHIKLITIDHGPEASADRSMQVFQCPALPIEEISAILSSYVGKRADVSNWAEWCEGSPRVAHAVGENLKHNPQDILKPPATVPIWDRFVLGHKKFDSKTAEEHFLVLRYIALFQRFGFEDPVSDEGKFISRLIAEADPSITWARFQSIVRHHQGRRILQGRHTLFIVPKALHVHLWVDFWNKHGIGFDFQNFIDRLPEGLKHWFLQLFIYAHASPVAQGVVKKILALPSGSFSNQGFLTSKEGTRLLNYLAEADPPATLEVLEETFAKWSLGDLRTWETGRQDIVWALEKIAVWKDLFPRAARVLGRLALAENAKHSNNSRGTFVDLFGIGLGWAATQAPPDDRFPILEELVKSSEPAERNLGLELCGEWLSTRGGTRIVGAEYQGMRPTLEFWYPKTYGDLFDSWRKVWRFLHAEIKSWSDADRRIGATRLIDSGVELAHYVALCDEVMETLDELAEHPGVDKAHFIRVVIRELRHRYSRFPKGVLAKLKRLDKKLTGRSFWERFCRFVLFTTWDEDHKVTGDQLTEETLPLTRVRKLAQEVVRDNALFDSHLQQFVTSEGHRLAQFGHEVAKQKSDADHDEKVFKALTDASTRATSDFVGGYLSAVRERDFAHWEALILRLLGIAALRTVAVNAVFRSGVSERVVIALLALYRKESMTGRVFSRIGFSARQCSIPEALVEKVIQALLDRNDTEAQSMCVELVDDYYCRDASERPLPKDLTYNVIKAQITSKSDRDGMRDFHWHRIANRYRKQYPEKDLDLLYLLLEHFDSLSRLGAHNNASQVADDIVRKSPKDSWKLISAAVERDKKHAYDIVMWLGDSGFEDRRDLGAMRLLDPNEIIEWTKAAPDDRIKLIYHGLPKSLDPSEGGAVTVLFLETFGNTDRVPATLISHFMYGGGWSGPRSAYLSRKRDEARKWLSQTKSPVVQGWLSRYILALGVDIESSQIEEERGF